MGAVCRFKQQRIERFTPLARRPAKYQQLPTRVGLQMRESCLQPLHAQLARVRKRVSGGKAASAWSHRFPCEVYRRQGAGRKAGRI